MRVLCWRTKTACRMLTWVGDTKELVVVGPEPLDDGKMELPEGVVLHEVPEGVRAEALAEQLGGYIITVFR